jgi:glyoxylate reductase
MNLICWEQENLPPVEIIKEWLKDADGLYSAFYPVNKSLLDDAKNIKVVTQCAVGYDNIDVQYCTERKIPVCNTPYVVVEATAELTYGLLICAARDVINAVNYVKDGKWIKNFGYPLSHDLHGKTLGIFGMGNVGTALARRANASLMNVIYHNRKPKSDDKDLNARYVSFEGLIEISDYIVILSPLTPETKGKFNYEVFKKMKKTSILINAARGPIVVTEDLYRALLNKEIAFAALDVVDPEPISNNSPLLSMPNVIITPHIGTATYETRLNMMQLAAENLFDVLEGKKPKYCVNPEVL